MIKYNSKLDLKIISPGTTIWRDYDNDERTKEWFSLIKQLKESGEWGFEKFWDCKETRYYMFQDVPLSQHVSGELLIVPEGIEFITPKKKEKFGKEGLGYNRFKLKSDGGDINNNESLTDGYLELIVYNRQYVRRQLVIPPSVDLARRRLACVVSDLIGDEFETIETHFEPQFPPPNSIDKYFGTLPEYDREIFVSSYNCFNYLLYKNNELLGIERVKSNYNNDATFYLSLQKNKNLRLWSEVWNDNRKGIVVDEIISLIDQCMFLASLDELKALVLIMIKEEEEE